MATRTKERKLRTLGGGVVTTLEHEKAPKKRLRLLMEALGWLAVGVVLAGFLLGWLVNDSVVHHWINTNFWGR